MGTHSPIVCKLTPQDVLHTIGALVGGREVDRDRDVSATVADVAGELARIAEASAGHGRDTHDAIGEVHAAVWRLGPHARCIALVIVEGDPGVAAEGPT